jgi:hypothetical protein
MTYNSGAKNTALIQKLQERRGTAYSRCCVCGERSHRVVSQIVCDEEINVCFSCTGKKAVEHVEAQRKLVAEVKTEHKFVARVKTEKTFSSPYNSAYFSPNKNWDIFLNPEIRFIHPEIKSGEVLFTNANANENLNAEYPYLKTLRRGNVAYDIRGRILDTGTVPWFCSEKDQILHGGRW